MAATKLNMLQAFFQRLTPCAGKLPLQVVFVREFSTTDELMIKRRHISKWKNKFPDQVYFEGDLKERCFDAVLDTRMKSKLRRRRTFKGLLDTLVEKERVVVTFGKGKALSRLAELLIDTAKRKDEPGVYTMLQRKELVPRVFEDLLPRYHDQAERYTKVYRLHSESLPFYRSGRLMHRQEGNAVVEFLGNQLPPLLPSEEELKDLTEKHMNKKKMKKDQIQEGTSL